MTYPNHKFSNFIDSEFSFNNKVNYPNKIDLIDSLKYERCDGTIMLEPRLQEYIKKKKYYKENNIIDCISLEKEFQITDRDKKIIKAFIQGDKNIYSPNGIAFRHLKRDPVKKQQNFPSKEYRDNDTRVLKPKKSDYEKPVNMGMFVPDGPNEPVYEVERDNNINIIDSRDFIEDSKMSNILYGPNYKLEKVKQNSGWKLDESKFNPSVDPYILNQTKPDRNKYQSQYRVHSFPVLKHPDHIKNVEQSNISSSNISSKDSYNGHYEKAFNLGQRILDQNNINTNKYGQTESNSYSGWSDMDTDLKIVIPNISNDTKRGLSTFNYKLGPFIGQNMPIRDSEFESSLIRGMPSITKKSYGYRNPDEHYFQYIDDDFQNPDNTVLPFPRGGESTRISNKKLARQKFIK